MVKTNAGAQNPRTVDLWTVLDAHAIEQVEAMVAHGWESSTAAQAWLGWVEQVAAAAADRAIAEVAWRAG